MILRWNLGVLLLPALAFALHAPPGAVVPLATANPRSALPVCALEPKPGERRAAVERILEVELARLQTAVEFNMARLSLPKRLQKSAPTTDEIAEEMQARGPMLRWAISRWLIEATGIEKYGVWCPTLKRLELHPWQWTPKGHPTLTTPTLVESLVALRPQITLEIKKGFRTSPLRVVRLAYRAAIVYALAAVSFLPGPQRKLIQRAWPRLVEHLATTLELNHVRVLQSGMDELMNEDSDGWLRPRAWADGCRRWLAVQGAECRSVWRKWANRRPRGKLRYAR